MLEKSVQKYTTKTYNKYMLESDFINILEYFTKGMRGEL